VFVYQLAMTKHAFQQAVVLSETIVCLLCNCTRKFHSYCPTTVVCRVELMVCIKETVSNVAEFSLLIMCAYKTGKFAIN